MTQTDHRYEVYLADAGHYRSLISCQASCPVRTDAAGYVRAIAEGRDEDAYLIARGPNPFAMVCGRICHAPCEDECRRGHFDSPVTIRRLKRFAVERVWSPGARTTPLEVLQKLARRMAAGQPPPDPQLEWLLSGLLRAGTTPQTGEAIAIIGAGPAGLAAAHDLALMGFRAVVFEAQPVPGGMLTHGVPQFRLPREMIQGEIDVVAALGVEIRCNMNVGQDIGFDELQRTFAAVVVATGLQGSQSLSIPGADGPDVFGAVELLRDLSLDRVVDLRGRLIVIGGGGVAYDAARSALRLPGVKSVHVCCLETPAEAPVSQTEMSDADAEGVIRHHRFAPLQIKRRPDGRIEGVLFCQAVSVFDAQGRFAPRLDQDTKTLIAGDCVVWAIGQRNDFSLPGLPAASLPARAARGGTERFDRRVVLAGDLAYGAAMAVDAIASGQRAAREVYEMLRGEPFPEETVGSHRVVRPLHARGHVLPAPVAVNDRRPPGLQAEPPLTVAEGRWHSGRCFDCATSPVVDSARCVLCGTCAEVCATNCIRLVTLDRITGIPEKELAVLIEAAGSSRGSLTPDGAAAVSALLKDEQRCVRCGMCARHCPAEAITMERYCVEVVRA